MNRLHNRVHMKLAAGTRNRTQDLLFAMLLFRNYSLILQLHLQTYTKHGFYQKGYLLVIFESTCQIDFKFCIISSLISQTYMKNRFQENPTSKTGKV